MGSHSMTVRFGKKIMAFLNWFHRTDRDERVIAHRDEIRAAASAARERLAERGLLAAEIEAQKEIKQRVGSSRNISDDHGSARNAA